MTMQKSTNNPHSQNKKNNKRQQVKNSTNPNNTVKKF